MAYFYIKDAERQRANDVMSSVLKQLCLKMPSMPKEAASQVESCYSVGEQPSTPKTMDIISSLATAETDLYIILDALDECKEVTQLMKLLSSICKDLPKNLHVLVASRDLGEIKRPMELLNYKKIQIGSSSNGHTESCNVIDNDILLYIEKSLIDQHYLNIRSDDIKARIKKTLVEKADGMYDSKTCGAERYYADKWRLGSVGFLVRSSSCQSL